MLRIRFSWAEKRTPFADFGQGLPVGQTPICDARRYVFRPMRTVPISTIPSVFRGSETLLVTMGAEKNLRAL